MTSRPIRLTDDALQRALIELAGKPDENALLNDVIRTVDVTPQLRRRHWAFPRPGRGVLLLAAVLATLGIGAAIAFSALRLDLRPDPPATPEPVTISVQDFVQDFTYTVPAGETLQLRPRGQPEHDVYALEMGSRALLVFPVWMNNTLIMDPSEVVHDLRDSMAPCMHREQPATLGNLPAVQVEFRPLAKRCPRLTFTQPGIDQENVVATTPSTLLVARTSHGTIGVLISAVSEEELAEWRMVAEQYIESFEFTRGPNRDPG